METQNGKSENVNMRLMCRGLCKHRERAGDQKNGGTKWMYEVRQRISKENETDSNETDSNETDR